MKKILLASMPLVLAASLIFHPAIEPLPLGSPVPQLDRKMMDISGAESSLKDAWKKNGLLVMFSCNTCPYVIKNQDRTIALAKYALSKDVGFVVLNANEGNRSGSESLQAMKAYADAQKYDWPYLVDTHSVMADAFGATRTPECFLFDKNNKLVYHGAIDDSPANASAVTRKHAEIAIREMIAGHEIAMKESRSVGCGIKRLD